MNQAGGIFGTHYGVPLTGSHLVVTKSHKEEAALQIIFILNFDTINDGEDGGVGDGSGERYHQRLFAKFSCSSLDNGEADSCEDDSEEVRYHIVARSHKEAETAQCLLSSGVATKHQHQGLPRGVGTTRRGYTNPLSWDTGVGIAPLTGCWYHSTDAFTMGSNCFTKICIYAASVFKPNNLLFLPDI